MKNLLKSLILLMLGLCLVPGFSASAQPKPWIDLDHLEPIDNSPGELQPIARIGRGWGNDIAWSPDGKTIAVASSVGVWLYQANDITAEPRLLQGTTPQIASDVIYSPDGKWLAVGTDEIQLWDTLTYTLARTMHTDGYVVSLAFDPSGKRLVSSNFFDTNTKNVFLWDVETGTQIFSLGGTNAISAGLMFSPDGAYITAVQVCDCDFEVYLWNVTPEGVVFGGEVDSGVNSQGIAFSPKGATLAIVHQDHVSMWNVETNTRINSMPFDADKNDYGPSGTFYSLDGQSIVTVSYMGILRVFDANTLQLIKRVDLKQSTRAMALSPDGTRIVALLTGGGLAIWEIMSGKSLAQLEDQGIPGDHFAIRPDGQQLATIGTDNTIWLWDMTTTGKRSTELKGHTDDVLDVAFSPDGTLLASASKDTTVRVWDAHTDQLLYTITAHRKPVERVILTSNGQLLTASDDGTARFWDAKTGEPLNIVVDEKTQQKTNQFTLWSGGYPIAGNLLVYDGQRLAMTDSIIIHVWDSQTNLQNELTQDDYSRPIHALALVNLSGGYEGNFLAAGGNSAVVQLWEDYSMNVPAFIIATPHNSWIYALAAGSDLLASGGCGKNTFSIWDGSPECEGADLRLWDFTKMTHFIAPPGHTEPIRNIAFSADDKLLLTLSDDGTILIWGVPTRDN